MRRTVVVSGSVMMVLLLTVTTSSHEVKQDTSPALVGPARWIPQEQTCSALANKDFSHIQDAPTQIMGASPVKASGAVPGYCKVTGYVAPQVAFELALPTIWNGKLIEMGCGGHCGILEEWFSGLLGCEAPLRRGYACIISDMGHRGTGGDGLWADGNLQAVINWGYRATHVTALAGKAITRGYYRASPVHSYFCGCSTGGRQALQEAQRFPWDFDGIIAGAPPIRLADLYVTFAWGQRAARNAAGKPLLTTEDLRLLTRAALAHCDLDDGVRDGIISDPFKCRFQAADLACKGAQSTGCLTPDKVRAAGEIYAGPVDGQGDSIFGAGAAPGSELAEPRDKFGGDWQTYYVGTEEAPAPIASLTQDGLKYLFFSPAQSPNWTIKDLNFDKDYKRLDVMESLYDSSNPDLSRFKAAGGKLLVYQGLNDLSILPAWVIRYYENVERVMGGREQTQSFVRLFELPGVEHCAGGPGADTVDYLTYLEQWVEQGKPPSRLIAAHLKKSDWTRPTTFPLDPSNIAFTRPVYPYPVKAKYLGQGDPNDASSFGPSDK